MSCPLACDYRCTARTCSCPTCDCATCDGRRRLTIEITRHHQQRVADAIDLARNLDVAIVVVALALTHHARPNVEPATSLFDAGELDYLAQLEPTSTEAAWT